MIGSEKVNRTIKETEENETEHPHIDDEEKDQEVHHDETPSNGTAETNGK